MLLADGSVRIENAILCSNVRIGEKASIKDCEFGTGFEALPGGKSSGHERRTVLTDSQSEGGETGSGPRGIEWGLWGSYSSACIPLYSHSFLSYRQFEVSHLRRNELGQWLTEPPPT